ncbi:MAG: arsenic transporter [Lachnospiraceae bacterium]|jgi:Na+/H+ antiporter NhaD/arsenite permease-like protein|nr:arsenic transporter [Lachnospiraceae bacterium]MCI1727003.1 arsenic transporter [Lachnospiraceae bacterium]
MKTVALILFIATYVFMLVLPKRRMIVVIISAALFLMLGILPLSEVPGVIDWNVLLMLAGTMGAVHFFIESGMPARMADILVEHIHSVKWVFISLALFAGIISAFIDNVATVLMIAPIGLAIAHKFKVSPVPVVLSIAVSSNLQGAATLVGDTTSIMLGSHLGMSFADFFVYHGHPGIFFVVEAGAIATIPVLMFIFRKEKGTVENEEMTEVTDHFPSFTLLGIVVTLIAASFIPNKPEMTNGFICAGYFLLVFLHALVKNKNRRRIAQEALASLDIETIVLLGCLFIVIAGISHAGLIDDISSLFVRLGGSSLFLTYTIVVWFSVLFSAFIDNIPYVAAMLPVVGAIGATLNVQPDVLYFGLLAGATLGGNLTPVGASANIAASGMLRQMGYTVKNKDFMRIGVPFTLVAVLTGYLLIWVFYA